GAGGRGWRPRPPRLHRAEQLRLGRRDQQIQPGQIRVRSRETREGITRPLVLGKLSVALHYRRTRGRPGGREGGWDGLAPGAAVLEGREQALVSAALGEQLLALQL